MMAKLNISHIRRKEFGNIFFMSTATVKAKATTRTELQHTCTHTNPQVNP